MNRTDNLKSVDIERERAIKTWNSFHLYEQEMNRIKTLHKKQRSSIG